MMPKRPNNDNQPEDLNRLAKSIVDRATDDHDAEHSEDRPTDKPEEANSEDDQPGDTP